LNPTGCHVVLNPIFSRHLDYRQSGRFPGRRVTPEQRMGSPAEQCVHILAMTWADR
jgi:hypothetical protein